MVISSKTLFLVFFQSLNLSHLANICFDDAPGISGVDGSVYKVEDAMAQLDLFRLAAVADPRNMKVVHTLSEKGPTGDVCISLSLPL